MLCRIDNKIEIKIPFILRCFVYIVTLGLWIVMTSRNSHENTKELKMKL